MGAFDGLDDVFGTEPAEIQKAVSDKPSLKKSETEDVRQDYDCLLYTSPSPRDRTRSRMPSSA